MMSPAFLLAGTGSGCGKTTVTLGLLAALARRGMTVQPFKCGPDFIDPSLHRAITGRVSPNLDARMCGDGYVQALFTRHAPLAGISVVEGVMGLFDGGSGSAAHLATLLDLPVVLVVDIRSAAESVAAVVHGFATLDPLVRVCGVICNRAGSERHCALVREALVRHCRIPLLGCLPRQEQLAIPSRHLGLHMGDEMVFDPEKLASWTATHLDLDLLLDLASRRENKSRISRGQDTKSFHDPYLSPGPPGIYERRADDQKPVRIGVARDAAFCFYYADNLELLKAAGAELVPFSPLHDPALPDNLQGIYLGGGYPELHGQYLSANRNLREQILAFSRSGWPLYAECGGFMYLTRAIIDQEGREFPMAGIFPMISRMGKGLHRLGYRQLTLQQDCLLGRTGDTLHGHEFHYSEMEPECFTPGCYLLDDGRTEGYAVRQTLASYVHLHWGRTPQVASRFVAACKTYGRQGNKSHA